MVVADVIFQRISVIAVASTLRGREGLRRRHKKMKNNIVLKKIIKVAMYVFERFMIVVPCILLVSMVWTGCGNVEKRASLQPTETTDSEAKRLAALDKTPPVTTIIYPREREIVQPAPHRIGPGGESTDNVAVMEVKISLMKWGSQTQPPYYQEYWNGTSWQREAVQYNARVTPIGQGAGSQRVSWDDPNFPPLPPQRYYHMQVRGIDSMRNIEILFPTVNFSTP